jgi:CheY-like chemotaxis protein
MAVILVVDDRAMERQFLVTLLSYAGHRVLEADDGLNALAVIRAEAPELVITDILMPTMDGFEFVRQMRSDRRPAARELFYTPRRTMNAQRRRSRLNAGLPFFPSLLSRSGFFAPLRNFSANLLGASQIDRRLQQQSP